MDPERRVVRTADGRSLDVDVSGPADGLPLVFHHGTPSSAVQFAPMAAQTHARGLRLVTYSRPGYGLSTRQAGRSVADCAADVAAILDALGAETCVTAGTSGGGPHALACAGLLPDRVRACASVAGVAPYGGEGLDFLAGMGEDNVREFSMALDDHDGLTAYMRAYEDAVALATPEAVIDALHTLLSPVDVAALSGELGTFFVANGQEALVEGIGGWFDDDLAFTRPWGFDLGAVATPVTIWQGAQDLMVPFAHGEWLAAHVAGARAELHTEEGHITIGISRIGEIVDDLLASAV
jgi:pimeloyl-ACP methyl ester carboxylesterase